MTVSKGRSQKKGKQTNWNRFNLLSFSRRLYSGEDHRARFRSVCWADQWGVWCCKQGVVHRTSRSLVLNVSCIIRGLSGCLLDGHFVGTIIKRRIKLFERATSWKAQYLVDWLFNVTLLDLSLTSKSFIVVKLLWAFVMWCVVFCCDFLCCDVLFCRVLFGFVVSYLFLLRFVVFCFAAFHCVVLRFDVLCFELFCVAVFKCTVFKILLKLMVCFS